MCRGKLNTGRLVRFMERHIHVYTWMKTGRVGKMKLTCIVRSRACFRERKIIIESGETWEGGKQYEIN